MAIKKASEKFKTDNVPNMITRPNNMISFEKCSLVSCIYSFSSRFFSCRINFLLNLNYLIIIIFDEL